MDIEKTTNLDNIRSVSYSQYSWWMKCPHKWYLDYVKGLKKFEDSINTCFGTAMHEVLQAYVDTLYNKSVQEADALDLNKMFKEGFEREIKDKKVLVDEDEFTEFCFDGKNIIAAFTDASTRISNFPNKKYEIVGIELEIITELIYNVKFKAYVDLILKDKNTGRIKIYDFKTSSSGWNSYMKDDETKYSQLLLYKAFYAQKYDVPLHMIDVEFFIVKRKLYENVNFPQSRIQKFSPDHRNLNVAAAVNGFGSFIKSCFNEDGSFIENEKNYPKVPGKGKKHCKWCPHKKVNCDAKETKSSSEK